MDYAIVLDKEFHFAKKLCSRLQNRFPTCIWSAISSLKEAYRQVQDRKKKPLVLIYTPEYFPAWKPLWACPTIQLRSQPLFEELFGLPLSPPPFSAGASETSPARIFRLDWRGIIAAVEALWPQSAAAPNLQLFEPGKLTLLASDLRGRPLESYLDSQLSLAQERGLRIFLIPLIDSRQLPTLSLQGGERLDRADLSSLAERLEKEDLQALQLLPYFFPTAIPGLLSLYTAEKISEITCPPSALRRLLMLVRQLLKRSLSDSSALLICTKAQTQILRSSAALCDSLCLLSSNAAFRSPAAFKLNEEIKASFPPGFPIQENCVSPPLQKHAPSSSNKEVFV